MNGQSFSVKNRKVVPGKQRQQCRHRIIINMLVICRVEFTVVNKVHERWKFQNDPAVRR